MTERQQSAEAAQFVRRSGPDLGFVSREVAGETIIVPISGRVGDLEAIYTLNAVGSRIWGLLAHPRTIEGLTEVIGLEFEVSRQQAAADVEEFVGTLRARGLVSILGEPPHA